MPCSLLAHCLRVMHGHKMQLVRLAIYIYIYIYIYILYTICVCIYIYIHNVPYGWWNRLWGTASRRRPRGRGGCLLDACMLYICMCNKNNIYIYIYEYISIYPHFRNRPDTTLRQRKLVSYSQFLKIQIVNCFPDPEALDSCMYTFPETNMYLDMGFETLNLKCCELRLWGLTVIVSINSIISCMRNWLGWLETRLAQRILHYLDISLRSLTHKHT